MKKLLSSLLLAGVLVAGARAQEMLPVDIAFIQDWWYRPSEVIGLRMGIPYAKNDSLTGLDIGFWGESDYAWAIQINLVASMVHDTMGGLQIGGYCEAGHLTGVQIGLWNHAPTTEGCQIGLVNLADETEGLQIGLINRTEMMHGYQIGLINVIRESPVPFCVGINLSF
jgi:hypothetical protein